MMPISVDMFSAFDAIDDGTEHNNEINKDAAHSHESLSRGMHGAADEFAEKVEHGSLRFCPLDPSGSAQDGVVIADAVSPKQDEKSRRVLQNRRYLGTFCLFRGQSI